MPSDLSGIRRKIERADEQIRVLNAEDARFKDRCKCRIVDEFDEHSRKHTFRLRGAPPQISPVFVLILGEAIYQLRTSLDHLVYQLAVHESDRVGQAVVKSTQRGFPVFLNEPVTEKQKSRFAGKVQGLSLNAIDDITQLQPWQMPPDRAKDYALVLLDELHNSDKHRLLTVIAGGMNIVKYNIGVHPGQMAEINVFNANDFRASMELEDGAEVGHCIGNAGVKVDIQTAFSIAFPKIGTAQYQPVVPTLQQLRDFVAHAVDSMRSHFQ